MKMFRLFLMVLAIFLIANSVYLTIKDRSIYRGDVNRDGRVNSIDLTMMKRHLFGIYDLDEAQIRIGDVNQNKRIDQSDINTLVEELLR